MKPKMLAAVAEPFEKPLALQERDRYTPGSDQPHVKSDACCVCSTYLHSSNGGWPLEPTRQFVQGHDCIEKPVGLGATSAPERDRAGMPYLALACGHCDYCLTAGVTGPNEGAIDTDEGELADAQRPRERAAIGSQHVNPAAANHPSWFRIAAFNNVLGLIICALLAVAFLIIKDLHLRPGETTAALILGEIVGIALILWIACKTIAMRFRGVPD